MAGRIPALHKKMKDLARFLKFSTVMRPSVLAAAWRKRGASQNFCAPRWRTYTPLHRRAPARPADADGSGINSSVCGIISLESMLIKRPSNIRASAITPKHLYLSRRRFLTGLPLAGAGFVAGGAVAGTKLNGIIKSPFSTTEKLTPYNDVTHY